MRDQLLSENHLLRNLGDEGAAGDLGLKTPPKNEKSRGEVGLFPATSAASSQTKKLGMLKSGPPLLMCLRSTTDVNVGLGWIGYPDNIKVSGSGSDLDLYPADL